MICKKRLFQSAEARVLVAHFEIPLCQNSIRRCKCLQVILAKFVYQILKTKSRWMESTTKTKSLANLRWWKNSFHWSAVFSFTISEVQIVPLVSWKAIPTEFTLNRTAGLVAWIVDTDFRIDSQTLLVTNHLLFKLITGRTLIEMSITNRIYAYYPSSKLFLLT